MYVTKVSTKKHWHPSGHFFLTGGKKEKKIMLIALHKYLSFICEDAVEMDKLSHLMCAFWKWLQRKSLSERGALYSSDLATSHAAEQTRRSLWKMKWQGQADGEQSTCQPKCQINLSCDQVGNYWNVTPRNTATANMATAREISLPFNSSHEQFLSVQHGGGSQSF